MIGGLIVAPVLIFGLFLIIDKKCNKYIKSPTFLAIQRMIFAILSPLYFVYIEYNKFAKGFFKMVLYYLIVTLAIVYSPYVFSLYCVYFCLVIQIIPIVCYYYYIFYKWMKEKYGIKLTVIMVVLSIIILNVILAIMLYNGILSVIFVLFGEIAIITICGPIKIYEIRKNRKK